MASNVDSFNIDVLLGFVTCSVSSCIRSGQPFIGSSAQAMYATHCAAELGRPVSVPKVSNTCKNKERK